MGALRAAEHKLWSTLLSIMVLQHVQAKLTKQDETEKRSNLSVVARCRGTNPSKSTIRNKDRATNVCVRDVNLDNVKLMEPRWRAKKYDKITMVQHDQPADSLAEESPCERKLTLQDFIVAGIGRRLSAKWGKKIGMHTSAYIVVPKATVHHEPVEAPIAEEPVKADRGDLDFSEMLDDDDFVVINVH